MLPPRAPPATRASICTRSRTVVLGPGERASVAHRDRRRDPGGPRRSGAAPLRARRAPRDRARQRSRPDRFGLPGRDPGAAAEHRPQRPVRDRGRRPDRAARARAGRDAAGRRGDELADSERGAGGFGSSGSLPQPELSSPAAGSSPCVPGTAWRPRTGSDAPTSTAAFSWRITSVLSSALTLLIVAREGGPSASTTLRGHDRDRRFPSRTRSWGPSAACSCRSISSPSVVLTSAACTVPGRAPDTARPRRGA